MYKPLDGRNIRVIPAIQGRAQETPMDKAILRTAAYCRVSSDKKEQETSFESQVIYYTNLINAKPGWTLTQIYADPAVSGTSRRNRVQFDQMIFDCIHGKIDQIITKSMSRFARNQLDSLAVIRLLRSLTPPVSVIFEDDGINSSDLSAEVIMSIFSMLAEQESAKKSENVKWGLRRQIERGNYMTPTFFLLGYEKSNGKMIITREEAKTVRIIYLMFLAGYKTTEIAYHLTRAGHRTGKGNEIWSASSVLNILKNERYCGDVLTNKTYVENYRAHHSAKNRGEVEQVYETDHHEGIVTHDEFAVAQRLVSSHRYGYSTFIDGSYTLKVIDNGLLSGFIPVNIRWAGSPLEEYIQLSKTVESDESTVDAAQRIPHYPGFQVVRIQDIGHFKNPAVRLSPSSLQFNQGCFECLTGTEHIEILFHPVEKLMAVRMTSAKDPDALRWKQSQQGKEVPVSIGCSAFTKLIYEMMNWPKLWNTSVLAAAYSRDGQAVLLFDLAQQEINALPYLKKKKRIQRSSSDAYYDIEAMIAQQIEMMHGNQDTGLVVTEEEPAAALPPYRRRKLHPSVWRYSFGDESLIATRRYRNIQFHYQNQWNISANAISVPGFDLHVNVDRDEAAGMAYASETQDNR